MRSGCGDSSLARKAIRPDQIRRTRPVLPDTPDQRNVAMKNDRPEPNAELQSFEPLRISFALLALLLGLIAAFHV
jgi:hypothetical protein